MGDAPGTATRPADGSASLRGRHGLLLTLLAGQLMANVDSSIVNVGIPALRADLHTDGAQTELIVGVYILFYALLLPAGARLGGMRGYRSAYILGVLMFTASSLVCGLAPSAPVLILARAVQGASAALMVPQILTGIQLAFTGAARTRALGLYAVTLSAGAVLGQILGGLLVSADLVGLSWRPAFLVNVPIGVALVLASRRLLPPGGHREAGRLDVRGMTVLAVAMVLFVCPLVFGREQGWPPWSWLSLLAGGPAFLVFVRLERAVAARGHRPFVNLDVLRAPAVAWGLICVAAGQTTYVAMMFTLPLHLQSGQGVSALWSGTVFATWAALFGVAGVYWRKIPASAWHLASPSGYGLLAVAYAAIALAVAGGLSGPAALMPLLGLGGLGLGLGFLPLVSAFTDSVSRDQSADLSGMISTVLQLSGVVGVATFGTLYLALAAPAAAPAAAAYPFTVTSTAFAAVAAFATVAAALSMRGRFPAVPRR
ncbi:MFS transporter [Streptomyces sp. TRM49041]|uniref:MFS transporter n=1 Tax=Streptomyces sp. TRM49041 TaxID=2603216 RepID=UPI0016568547|nr:MFS transporter [Streptomyces sp. TRM49041]